MEKEFKVGIIGNGNIYNLAHKHVWQETKRARVVATCDIIEERAKNAYEEFRADRYSKDFHELLKNDDIDLVDICTPSHLHAEMAIKSLESGKHVICEKPIATTLEDAKRMIEASRLNGKHLFIGHTRRFDDRWVQIKEAISSGRIGEPVSVRRSERSWVAFPEDDWHWKKENGGVTVDLGIHVVDLARWFLEAEPVEVFAKLKSIREEAKIQGCYDFGVMLVNFENGKQAVLEVSWVHRKEYAPFYSTTEVIGRKGKIQYSDKDSNPAVVVGDTVSIPRFSPMLSSMPHVFTKEIEHFLDCIWNGRKPRITAEDANTALKVIVSAIKSAEEGRPIKIK
jgi:predicted dehydrogenase